MTARSTAPADALAEAIPFDFDGLALSVKPSSEWSIRSLDRLERGYVTTWLELVLAGDSYEKVIDADLKPEAVSRLIQVTQKTAGVRAN